MADNTSALQVIGLSAGYNGRPVVHDIDFEIAPGEVVALLGSNGAGKTTLLSAIAGLIKPLGGTVRLDGRDVTGKAAHKLARAGIALVPEDRSLFLDLTARENLLVASPRGGARKSEERVLGMLPELKKCLGRKAGLLSGGEQQMLAVGRALVSTPRVLIVDEVSLGLAPVVVDRLLPVLKDVAEKLDAGVLIVEQHVPRALEIASRALVIAHGRIVLQGTSEQLRADPELIASSYLGDIATAAALEPDLVATDDPVATTDSATTRKTRARRAR